MEFLYLFSRSTVFMALAIFVPLIYSLFTKSRKARDNKIRLPLPPEPTGRLPVIGHLHLLGGSQPPHITLEKMAEKIGPIYSIKLGVHRALIVSSWEMVKECFTTNDKAFREGKRTEGLYQGWLKNKNSNNKLEVEMIKWFWDVSLNGILKMVVGKRYVEYIKKDEDINESGHWRYALRDFFQLSGKFAVSDALPYLRWLDIGGVEKEMQKTTKVLDNVMTGWLEEHKKKRASGMANSEEDFMDVMLSLLDDSKQISNRDADTVNKATCLALILAASDTTKTTLTWTLSLLLNNPEVLKKAKDELDMQVGKERQVKDSDIKHLTYLQAIIKESLRLYPAAPLSVPRVSIEDCVVGGYRIPAGTRLFVHISKIQRDPRVWENPSEFQPERFLTNHKDIDVKGQNYELIPFSTGRRICPGASFALQVLNLSLATLLHAFDIETPLGKPVDMTEGHGITNLKATPLDVLLTPRLPAHLY
ncbi:cytochrome P450 CYP82D47 [Jatropha curcas]|uniref:cytochrome P450 CYP82D47 n=1 Tax=Jatropha curcas TaxID=180498 RepID=UPI001894FA09|nr:cytochrome P450 CYP82D47 [Jatropha curcas]